MSSLYFSISALLWTILIFILYFSKERIKSKETNIYGFMIISSLIDLILVIVELLITYFYDSSLSIILVKFLNKIDFIHYIVWPTLFFLYVLSITIKNEIFFKKVTKIVLSLIFSPFQSLS